jgi:hypothetical protein
MEWLRKNYPLLRFIMERDNVWTSKKELMDIINDEETLFKSLQ